MERQMTGNLAHGVSMCLKKCSRCKITKPVTEFYKNKAQRDGLEGWCKDCSKIASRKYYSKSPIRREYEKNYLREYRRAGYGNKADYKTRNIEKILASRAVERALHAGVITKQEVCSECGIKLKVVAHHYKGYQPENWLVVQWLCHKCHMKKHRKLTTGED